MARILSFIALTCVATCLDFEGQGQIVALAQGGTSIAEGCLTDAGLWTLDTASCGLFTGTHNTTTSVVTLSTTSGACYTDELDSNYLSCGGSAELRNPVFLVRLPGLSSISLIEKITDTLQAWPGLVEDKYVLASGDSYIWASQSDPAEGAVQIHVYGTTDARPYLDLTWAAV